MQTAKIEEDRKPPYEAVIEELDPANTKGAFEASQFTNADKKLSVPGGIFNATLQGKTYRCAMLVATHFTICDAPGAAQKPAAASGR